jgi:hypothetical protein
MMYDLEVWVSTTTDDDVDSVATTQRAGTSATTTTAAHHHNTSRTAAAVTPTTLSVTNRQDDTLVKGARAVVMVVLVVSAAVVASLAYVLLSRHEYDAFRDQVRTFNKNSAVRAPKVCRVDCSQTSVDTHTHGTIYLFCTVVTVLQQCQSSHQHGQKECRQCLCQY